MSNDISSLINISIELGIEINYESEELTDNNHCNSFQQPLFNPASSAIHYDCAKTKPVIETCSNTVPIARTGESTSEDQNSHRNWHKYISIIEKGTSCLYQCKTCLRKFRTKANFKYHKFCGLNDDKPFKCVFCEKTFITGVHYNYHIRVHIGERPWQCHVCGHDFIDKGKLSRHSRTHGHRERLFACLTCSKKYYTKSSLYTHQKFHCNYRTFLCRYCGESFPTNSWLMNHLSSNTEHDAGKHNHKGHSSKLELDIHLKGHSRSEDLPFLCYRCDKKFLIRGHLMKHLRFHYLHNSNNGEKHVTNNCNNYIQTISPLEKRNTENSKKCKDEFTKQVQTETRENLFVCDICHTRFTTLRSLTNHLKVHSGDRQFVCYYCGKRFTTNSDLTKHSYSHSPQIIGPGNQNIVLHESRKTNLFSCHICTETFSLNKDLVRHILSVHTSERPFRCDKCNVSYKRKDNFDRHLRNRHGV